jgi:hypothetical protein
MIVVANWVLVWCREEEKYFEARRWVRDLNQYHHVYCWVHFSGKHFRDDVRSAAWGRYGDCNYTIRLCDIFKE